MKAQYWQRPSNNQYVFKGQATDGRNVGPVYSRQARCWHGKSFEVFLAFADSQAILLTDDHHLIEFPSLLLPQGVTSGSIVNIAVNRNFDEEARQLKNFWDLQEDIFQEFGQRSPKAPELRLRNTTQTSVTLEWSPLVLETASLKSLDIYKNNQRLTTIHNPTQTTISKHSGLEMDNQYTFHLVLRTSAGTFQSDTINVKTHTVTNLTGLNICFGQFSENEQSTYVPHLKEIVAEIGAKVSKGIQIDTTHLVCSVQGGPEWKKAVDMSIPIVTPEWLNACRTEQKLINVHGYYLGGTGTTPTTSSHPPLPKPNVPEQQQVPPAKEQAPSLPVKDNVAPPSSEDVKEPEPAPSQAITSAVQETPAEETKPPPPAAPSNELQTQADAAGPASDSAPVTIASERMADVSLDDNDEATENVELS